MKRRSIVVLLVGLLLLMTSGAASAQVEVVDTHACPPQGGTVVIQSHGSVLVRHYWPASTLQWSFWNQAPQGRTTHTGLSATSWKVTASDTLSHPGTYAFCTGV